MASSTSGICYLVGAGPGDLGLVTLRAKECIEIADVIVYDYLSNPEMLKWAKPGTEFIYAGKKAKDHAIPQGGINELLVAKAKEGKVVTRLKGGDPMIFGRGGEEAAELADAGVLFEIVPGISSAIAGPAYAGIPVTHRAFNTQLTIFTGHEDPTKAEASIDYHQLATAPGTKVMLMGVERIGVITGSMIEAGAPPDLPVAMVRWATTGRQQTVTGTLSTIAGVVASTGFKAPAVAVFGEVVTQRDKINWFEKRPLFGKSVVVTRTRKQAGELSRQLRHLGADAFELPTIRIDPPPDPEGFARLVIDAHTYDWILFTSPNGVDSFFDMFFKAYHDARALGAAKIAAIGPGTAQRVKDHHLAVDLLPDEFVAESLVESLVREVGSVENLTFLWVRAERARDVVSDGLTKAGAIVDQGIAYRTVAEKDDVAGGQKRFVEEGADVITFTSSSTVEHFLDLGLPLPPGLKIASIGPITSRTLKERGLYVDIEAEKHDIPGLVAAIGDHYRKSGG
ncbi:uroporphyrinogen-III C-methyltransferase [soil metagenome]